MAFEKKQSLAASMVLCLFVAIGLVYAKQQRPSPQPLDLHTGSSIDAVIAKLGTPSERVLGYPNTSGDAQRQLREMGIETLVYRGTGVTVYARHGKVFSVDVVPPFGGEFHGVKLGADISQILTSRGNPDQTYFGPDAKRATYKEGEKWKWSVSETQAGYYISNEPSHVVIYNVDLGNGKVREISETDFAIRGQFFLIPTYR